ncbi:MAG: DUF503 domain-containing protein [Myxococcota bacterium]|nr:DUF503 domain-containing protein [Myxococcota bacterium]
MIVGAALVELHVHGSHSLKAKRGVVRSVVSRVRNRFNVSVAEVGGQDTWQRAVLGISASGCDRVRVRQTLDRTVAFIDSLHLAEIRASDVEIVDLPQEEESDEELFAESLEEIFSPE